MAGDARTDEALMRAYVDGDHEAFRALFERYAPMLMRLTVRHLRSEELAREVVQQTFFQMHAARNDFRRDAKLRPWVFTIAMNLVREHYRKKKRRKETELDEHRAEAPQRERGPLERKERAQLLRVALSKLPDTQREVVELHWFEERPFAEVAQIVGSTEGAVRVRAHRAYKKLAEMLRGELGA
ncbi:MAG TPA: sigma-70 family RNA polymerase sigma factor [Sandaracinaceae bacterium LLY-WYZ-13_1]|nr:sigma-70 family RNA polymerase sigma factor [Sandaracinaceae bacterium LLY-WYZ-13_1]